METKIQAECFGFFYKLQIFHHKNSVPPPFSHYGLLNYLWDPEYLLLVLVLLSPNTNFSLFSIILLSEKKQGINLLCFGKSDECYIPDLLLNRDCGAGVGRDRYMKLQSKSILGW